MNLENEDQHITDQPAEINYESQKKLKITYTRDFLLSLSELDVCKKLPNGFDKSHLSEFEDAPQDRPKISSGLSFHSYRQNEYGSSPPTRGDSGNYSRGIHGRWDSRFSGRSDRDSDSQSDWDSDSGRRYGNQSRKSWQGLEHDGLLGSGSFAKTTGFAAGVSAPKFRANDHYQLNKSNEPYHPPRPYKAVPHSRRETNDSFNDETFGSDECTSEDRAEEERKRRVSFELMRKEQHKAFQENQRLNSGKHKDEFDISTLMEDSKDDDGISSKSKQFDEPVMPTNKDSDKSILPSQTPASRPLVPPGFAGAPLERNIGTKTTTHSHSSEVGNSELKGGILHAKGNRLLNGAFDNQEQSTEKVGLSRQLESNIYILANDLSHEVQTLSSDLVVSNKTVVHDSELYKNSNLLKSFEASKKSEGVEVDAEVTDNKTSGESNQGKSSSILDKLFGSVSTGSGGDSDSLVEQPNSKAHDTWSPHAVHSSKFAHWFIEEEKKPVDELSSGRPNDLLSLIVGCEKGGSQPSDVKAVGRISFGFSSKNPEIADTHLASNTSSVTLENCEQLSEINICNPAAVPAVLTCEDLEQSILSEINGSDDILRSPVQGSSVTDAKTEQTKANVDDHASHHLLSLLQKGTGLEDVTQSSSLDVVASGKPCNVEVASIHGGVHDPRETNAENVSNSGKSLTLETLFGTAFMKELQSIGAPSSAQKSSIGRARVVTSELHDGLLSSNLETGSGRMSYRTSILASHQPEPIKADRIEEHLLGFDDQRTEVDSSQFQNEFEKCGGFDRSTDVRLPEEDSLIALSDPMKHLRNSSKAKLFSSQAASVDITEKLAGLNSALGNERPAAEGQEGLAFLRGPFDLREHDLSFHNLHVQPSSPQFHHPQLNHVGPLFNPLDSHPANINSPMKFVGSESIIHNDPPLAPQFPTNMLHPSFHHPSSGLAGFEPSTHHHPMLQHMQESFPPPHLIRGFPSAPNSNNQMAGFIQDGNSMPGFPFGHRQPNFNGLPIPPSVPEVEGGNNNPEMIQRLIEMELKSSTKQIHPLATAGHNKGMRNFELDTGFGYR